MTDTTSIPPNQIQPIITTQKNNQLIAIHSPEEILNAINVIGSLKAPKLDGFPNIFYKYSLDHIDHNIEAMVTALFTKILDLLRLNQTNITLIPKIKNPSPPNYL